MPDLQPADAVARVLDTTVEDVEALVEQGVLTSVRGRFDVLACVRQYAAHLRGKIPTRIDWTEARRLYEEEGSTFRAIAERLGCSLQAVSAKSKRFNWLDRSAVVADARAAAIRKFVEQDTEAVLANLATKHELNRDLMLLIRRHVDRWLGPEQQRPDTRATKALRDLCLAVRTIETVDTAIARFAKGVVPGDETASKLPQLPADFDFLEALRKRPKGEEQRQ